MIFIDFIKTGVTVMYITLIVKDSNGVKDYTTIEFDSVEKLRLVALLFHDVDLTEVLLSDRGQLALAVLRNKLECAPLAMLVDEIQTTQEYAEQSKHHPKYSQLYELLFDIGQGMKHGKLKDYLLATQIGRLLAPCHTCSGTGYAVVLCTQDETEINPCKECTNGYQKDFYTGSTPFDSSV